MQIQNEAQVNEVPTSHEALLKKLKKVEEENRQLRMQIFDADHLEKEKVRSLCTLTYFESTHKLSLVSTAVLVAETPTFILWCSCYGTLCATIGNAEGKSKSSMVKPE